MTYRATEAFRKRIVAVSVGSQPRSHENISVRGIVGFNGHMVSHVVRNIVGSDHKEPVVGRLFAGPALLVAAEVGAHLGSTLFPGSAGRMAVGIVT